MTGVATAVEPPAVPSSLLGFLTQLAVALHKTRAYPAGHPMRTDSVSAAYSGLAALLADRVSLKIVVARRQLVIDGAATDPDHFIMRDLASKLSRLQVGALVVHRGVTEANLTAVIEHLAMESAKSPVARHSVQPWASEGVEVVPLSFDALAMDGRSRPAGDSAAAADAVWKELAHRMLHGPTGRADSGASTEMAGSSGSGGGGAGGAGSGGGGAGGGGEGRGAGGSAAGDGEAASAAADQEVETILNGGPAALAAALGERVQRPELRDRLAGTLERVARAATTLPESERRVVEVRLRHLLAALPPEALQTLLNLELTRREDVTRLATATEWLPVPALLELIEAAGKAQGQGISTFLLRLVRKLEKNAEAGGHVFAGGDDLRVVLRTLLESWTLASPNPWHHTVILENLARTERSIGAAVEQRPNEGLRLLLMAIETDVVGEQVLEGVDLAVEAGDLGQVLDLLATAPAENRAAAVIFHSLLTPQSLRRIVKLSRTDPAVLKRLLVGVGESNLDLLLDLLTESSAQAVQRALLERIVELGPPAVAVLTRRLASMPSDSLRTVLRLLAELPELPDGLAPRDHTTSAEPMVRLEAYRVMLRNPAERDEAIHGAFTDPDERVVRVAIDAGLEDFPRGSLARLMLLLSSPARSVELRARAVAILGQFDTPAVRAWLTDRMTIRKGLFRRVRLVSKSPLVLAKIKVLAERWAGHPDAERVLRLARASGDRELVVVAGAAASEAA